VKARSTATTVLAVLAATILLALSGTMAWATVNDFTERVAVPLGVSVADSDLSGMTEAQARAAIEEAVAAPLMEPVAVVADGREFTFDPRGTVEIDVDGMVAEAFEPRRAASYLARIQHDIVGTPLSAQIEPRYTVDETVMAAWLKDVAKQVNRRAVDASITVVGSKVRLNREKSGRRVDLAAAAPALAAAFSPEQALSESKTVEIPVKKIKPKVTAKKLPKTIVVDLSQRRIRLYKGAKLEVTYPCAIGTPYHPTPTGHFEVVGKRYMPTWVNPAPNGWGASMPKSIPPGPGNPLGTRAINLSASGIRFHGTQNIGSIGTAASHGCMRMRMHDVEDFYPRVKIGTQVYIVR